MDTVDGMDIDNVHFVHAVHLVHRGALAAAILRIPERSEAPRVGGALRASLPDTPEQGGSVPEGGKVGKYMDN